MRTIEAKKLTKETFEPYGSYYDLMNPSGNTFGEFFPDHVIFPVSGQVPMTCSALQVPRRESMVVTSSEYHDKTGEGMICMDSDVVIHVAVPSVDPVPEKIEAFYIPRGTVVYLNIGVWHLAPFPVDAMVAHMMILLPQRTYKNDCVVVEYDEKDQVEIKL
ncbi:ureidoglycolate lyase [Lachnospiraceae bacterium LCP25S3_G4]